MSFQAKVPSVCVHLKDGQIEPGAPPKSSVGGGVVQKLKIGDKQVN